jgi:hypothetical protein
MRKVALLLACLIVLQLLVGTLTASAGWPTWSQDGGYTNPGSTPATTGYALSYYPYPSYTGYSTCDSPYFNTYANGYYEPSLTCSYVSTCSPYLPVPFWWEYPYYPGGCCDR